MQVLLRPLYDARLQILCCDLVPALQQPGRIIQGRYHVQQNDLSMGAARPPRGLVHNAAGSVSEHNWDENLLNVQHGAPLLQELKPLRSLQLQILSVHRSSTPKPRMIRKKAIRGGMVNRHRMRGRV